MSNDPTPEAVDIKPLALSIGELAGAHERALEEIRALRTKLADVEAERDDALNAYRNSENVIAEINTVTQPRPRHLDIIAHTRAITIALKEHIGEATQLRAALTSQQEAMDTAVRALEKLSSAVSARMCDGPEPAHDKVVRLMEAYDEARSFLAQLRASREADRAAQFPESGKGVVNL